MTEDEVIIQLQAVVRYFNNRRPGVFSLVGTKRYGDKWAGFKVYKDGVPCGSVDFGSDGYAISSPHIKMKRYKRSYGNNTQTSKAINRAIDSIDTYIRVPSMEEFIKHFLNKYKLAEALSTPLRQEANTHQEAMSAILRGGGYDIKVDQVARKIIDGVSEAEEKTLEKALVGYETAKREMKIMEQTITGIVYNPKKETYWVYRSNKEPHTYTPETLPDAMSSRLAVLKVCDQNTPTPCGIWVHDKVTGFDVFNIYGESLLNDPGSKG